MSHPEWGGRESRASETYPADPTTPHLAASDDHSNSTAGHGISSSQRSWFEVYEFVQRLLVNGNIDADDLHPAGTPAWLTQDDGDVRKLLSCALEGVHHVLRVETAQLAIAEASRAVSAAVDWPQVAREVHARKSFRATRPWAKRVVVS